MDRESFKRWLDSYGQAWKGGYPQAHAAAYQVTPFSEPIRRREAIDQYSDGVEKTEERIQFEYEVLVLTDAQVIARWRHLLCDETKLDGIVLISLDSNGRCQSLREWWYTLQ